MKWFKRRLKIRKPKWEEVPDTFSGLQCNFVIRCPMCRTETPMTLFDIKNLNFNVGDLKPIQDSEEFLLHPKRTSSHAVDVAMMCMECGYHDIFGVAIGYDHSVRNWQNVASEIEKRTGRKLNDAISGLLRKAEENRKRAEGN